MKLYMTIYIRQNFSPTTKIFLSETFFVELPKNLVICFKGTLASLLLDTTKTPHSYLLLLNIKQRISVQLLKLQITENHLKAPKIISKHPKVFGAIGNYPRIGTCNHPEPGVAARGRPWSAGVYLGLAAAGLVPFMSMCGCPQSFA